MTDPILPGEEPVGFSVQRKDDGGLPTVVLQGELDLRAASELREALLEALGESEGTILLDMSGLSFIDSTIISVLIMAKKRAELAGGEVRLRNMPERVRRVFAVTGIEELFPVEDA